jgi:hypothetical protein
MGNTPGMIWLTIYVNFLKGYDPVVIIGYNWKRKGWENMGCEAGSSV